ncbi:Ribosome production factor 1, partial [Elasticomyces elasticus]
MGARPLQLSDKAALPFKTANKFKRQDLHVKQKKARDAIRRTDRFARKREESKNPELREQILAQNVPITIDSKRKYDEIEDEPEDGGLGVAFNVEKLKRRKLAEEQQLEESALVGSLNGEEDNLEEEGGSDRDSMLDDEEGGEGEEEDDGGSEEDNDSIIEPPEHPDAEVLLPSKAQIKRATERTKARASSPPARSTTSTNMSLAPAALVSKFPTLFLAPDEQPPAPKILVTTSINSNLHHEAEILCGLLPNSKYVRRSSHRYGHKFSIKEISEFATKRDYTTVVVLEEDYKKVTGLVVVHLPIGPTFHFSITNWYEGKSIPGHGRSTSHIPELILNNFVTPL